MIDHDVDGVAGLDPYFATRSLELFDGDQAFGFIAEIDDDFLVGYLENCALQDLAFGGRSEVAVILEQVLVILFSPKEFRISMFLVLAASHS